MKTHIKILRFCLMGCYFHPWSVMSAGISTDGSFGAITPVSSTMPGTVIVPQSLGRLSNDGSSLFHSFQEFNVHLNQNVLLEANSPQRIIMRVTGTNPSEINGQLGLSGLNNNAQHIFLLNPNGVVIGANAAINIPGVFHYTNLPIMRFSDGSFFSAFDKAGSTLSSAPVTAFGFVERTGIISAPLIVPYDPTKDITGTTSVGIFYIKHLPPVTPLNPQPIGTNPSSVNPLPINPPPVNSTPMVLNSQPINTNPLPVEPNLSSVNPLPINPPPVNSTPIVLNSQPINPLPINPTPVNANPLSVNPAPTANSNAEKITQAALITKDTAEKPLLTGFITDTKINQVIAKQDIPIRQTNLITANTFIQPTTVFNSANLIKPTATTTTPMPETPLKQVAFNPPVMQQNTDIQQTPTDASPILLTNSPPTGGNAPSSSAQPAMPPADNVLVVDINSQNRRLGLQAVEPYPCRRENFLMRVGRGGIPANEMSLGFIPPVNTFTAVRQAEATARVKANIPFIISKLGASFPCAAL